MIFRLLTITLLLGLWPGAACSADQPGDTGDNLPSGEEVALAYAACMRDHGVDWPDPVPVDGEWRSQPGDDVDLESDTYKTAETECQAVFDQTPPGAGGPSPADRAETEEIMEQMLEFAACMRDQGVDFPDPQIDDSGSISGPAGPMDGDWEAFDAARLACEEQLGESMP